MAKKKYTLKDLKGIKGIRIENEYGEIITINIYTIYVKTFFWSGKTQSAFKGKWAYAEDKNSLYQDVAHIDGNPTKQILKEINNVNNIKVQVSKKEYLPIVMKKSYW